MLEPLTDLHSSGSKQLKHTGARMKSVKRIFDLTWQPLMDAIAEVCITPTKLILSEGLKTQQIALVRTLAVVLHFPMQSA